MFLHRDRNRAAAARRAPSVYREVVHRQPGGANRYRRPAAASRTPNLQPYLCINFIYFALRPVSLGDVRRS